MMYKPTTDNRQPIKKTVLFVVGCLSLVVTSGVSAQSVDLLWQGETYTPPFYEGRSLFSNQAGIKLVAIPHGLGDPANLDYKWTRNNTVLGNSNGIGKNTISLGDSGFSRSQNIKVEVVEFDAPTQEDIILTSNSITVSPIAPTLLIYENHPLYGFLFNREISGIFELKGYEVTLGAFPFFFNATNRTDSWISYEWHTNSGGLERGNLVTYRAPENVSGSAKINTRVTNQNQLLQSADKSFLIQF